MLARRRGIDQRMRPVDLVELCLATYAASQVIARERVGAVVREPLVEHARDPASGGFAVAAAQLVRCSRCVGAWNALALSYLRVASPTAAREVHHVLAAVGANNFLQAAFATMRDHANRLAPTDAPPHAASDSPTGAPLA
jgi:hypothetical protein